MSYQREGAALPSYGSSYGHDDDSAVPPPYVAIDNHVTGAPRFPMSSYETEPPYTYEAEHGSSSSRVAGVNSKFPQSINAYMSMKFTRTFHLGEHADNPLFAVETHTGWSGKPLLTLHSGPTESAPVLATARHEGKLCTGKTVIFTIFPDPARDTGEQSTTFVMRREHSWKHPTVMTYQFSVEVGLGKDVRMEDFEWRHSRSNEVRNLDKYSWGWKLVRLDSSSGKGGERASRSAGETSDGKEVVAAWSMNSGWSRNKAFKFQYLESGATGVLGEKFATAALMTGLKFWFDEWQANQSSACASTGASAAVAVS
ncbi:hypothetical protein GGS26DRAFT_523612 [Hypomontagnella submonticulosa]|nr:hypothetical protein GGS26DRAFT_523612 [Hypomontagnella submonticulosa]